MRSIILRDINNDKISCRCKAMDDNFFSCSLLTSLYVVTHSDGLTLFLHYVNSFIILRTCFRLLYTSPYRVTPVLSTRMDRWHRCRAVESSGERSFLPKRMMCYSEVCFQSIFLLKDIHDFVGFRG